MPDGGGGDNRRRQLAAEFELSSRGTVFYIEVAVRSHV